MKRSDYIPPIQHLVKILDARKGELTTEDLRMLNKVKNWIRQGEEKPLSLAKINPPIHSSKARGMMI